MLSAVERKRYARQLLLPEIGLAGQARLLGSVATLPAGADLRAAEVAADYLQRAGVAAGEAGEAIELPTPEAVLALAGRPELREAAAALSGAFAAVEAIKRVLGVGQRGALPSSLTRCQEPTP